MANIAIITGATGGIGQKFIETISLQEEIDEIWAIGRNKTRLREIAGRFEKVVSLEMDLAKEGIRQMAEKLEQEKPIVRMLINNAGAAYMGLFEKMEPELVEEICSINCSVPAMLMRVVLPYMKQKSRILNISSASSFQPNPYLAMYSASKIFLKNLSRALNQELKPQGITVTAVCPGWVDTGMLPREKDGRKIKYTGMISADKVVTWRLRIVPEGKTYQYPVYLQSISRGIQR